jgi:hypothetical protein
VFREVSTEMVQESVPSHGSMEEKGAYNAHAKLQAGGGALALPLLEQAARNLAIDDRGQPIFIADYGSSQGKNSLVPMRLAIETLRARVSPDHPIFVFHVDQPANDFNTLFNVLDSDTGRYSREEPNVFPCAIGRSFYQQVLPDDRVHLGWSSYAAVWLSRIPRTIPGHFLLLGATGEVRAEFDRQGAEDWAAFLSVRARELRPGGRLIVVLPAFDGEGWSGFESIMENANAALAEMVEEGAITAEERARMVLGCYPRNRGQLLAPFEQDGQFRQLTVECCDRHVVPDPAWAAYERDGDKESVAARHALFFRSTFAPSLISALPMVNDEGRRLAFFERLEAVLKRRIASSPSPLHSNVETIVLAKQTA